jgi:hypothetical protein
MNSNDIKQLDFLTENMNRMEKMLPVLLEMKDKTVSITAFQESILVERDGLLSLIWHEWNNNCKEFFLLGGDISSRRKLPEGGKE